MRALSHKDSRACIALLLDDTVDESERIAAAESLMYSLEQDAKDALFQIVMDESCPDDLREEAAGSLGSLWVESGIEYERLRQIVPPFLDEAVCDFDYFNIRIDKPRLGAALVLFQGRYSERAFMA